MNPPNDVTTPPPLTSQEIERLRELLGIGLVDGWVISDEETIRSLLPRLLAELSQEKEWHAVMSKIASDNQVRNAYLLDTLEGVEKINSDLAKELEGYKQRVVEIAKEGETILQQNQSLSEQVKALEKENTDISDKLIRERVRSGDLQEGLKYYQFKLQSLEASAGEMRQFIQWMHDVQLSDHVIDQDKLHARIDRLLSSDAGKGLLSELGELRRENAKLKEEILEAQKAEEAALNMELGPPLSGKEIFIQACESLKTREVQHAPSLQQEINSLSNSETKKEGV